MYAAQKRGEAASRYTFFRKNKKCARRISHVCDKSPCAWPLSDWHASRSSGEERKQNTMLRIRFHGRGGQGMKTASRMLGSAAFHAGLVVQDSPVYGAERRGAPMSAMTRIAREPIRERGMIARPDLVVIADDTLLTDSTALPLAGCDALSTVVLNSTKTESELRQGCGAGWRGRRTCCDITSGATRVECRIGEDGV